MRAMIAAGNPVMRIIADRPVASSWRSMMRTARRRGSPAASQPSATTSTSTASGPGRSSAAFRRLASIWRGLTSPPGKARGRESVRPSS